MDKYSSAAYRSFKTFIGELTAVAAGIFVGIQEVIPVVQGHADSDPWKMVAKKHGIVVNGLSSKSVVDSSVRLNLVSLYSGFDLFMTDIRATFNDVQGRAWIQHDGDAPFTALGRNTRPEVDAHIERLGAHRIAAMDHYRLVRNAVAHPTQETLSASKNFFAKNAKRLQDVRSKYGMQAAPNDIDHLTFHDIKLLARVALDVTKAIDALFDPGDLRLQELMAARPIDKTKSAERKYNALAGWLQTQHGLSPERAKRIIDAHLTQELDG